MNKPAYGAFNNTVFRPSDLDMGLEPGGVDQPMETIVVTQAI